MVTVEQHPKPRQRKGTIKDNMISDNAYLVLRSKIIVIVQQDFSNANTRTEATLTERAPSWRRLKNQPSICIVFYACPPCFSSSPSQDFLLLFLSWPNIGYTQLLSMSELFSNAFPQSGFWLYRIVCMHEAAFSWLIFTVNNALERSAELNGDRGRYESYQ